MLAVSAGIQATCEKVQATADVHTGQHRQSASNSKGDVAMYALIFNNSAMAPKKKEKQDFSQT